MVVVMMMMICSSTSQIIHRKVEILVFDLNDGNKYIEMKHTNFCGQCFLLHNRQTVTI